MATKTTKTTKATKTEEKEKLVCKGTTKREKRARTSLLRVKSIAAFTLVRPRRLLRRQQRLPRRRSQPRPLPSVFQSSEVLRVRRLSQMSFLSLSHLLKVLVWEYVGDDPKDSLMALNAEGAPEELSAEQVENSRSP